MMEMGRGKMYTKVVSIQENLFDNAMVQTFSRFLNHQ